MIFPGNSAEKCDLAGALLNVVIDDEERFAGEGAFEHAAEAAAGIGLHLDRLRHPAHPARGGVDAVVRIEGDGDDRKGCAFYSILHPYGS